jgi:hypothetical protein
MRHGGRKLVTTGGVGLVLAVGLAACGNASSSANGGQDLFDASPALAPPATNEGTGITWTDLYRDFFGKAAPGPGCKGNGNCHGASDQGGGGVWVCGDTQDSCWKGLTTASPPLIDTKDPPSSVLMSVALRTKQGGNMPIAPAGYVFSDAAIKRIQDWMAAGAQNN